MPSFFAQYGNMYAVVHSYIVTAGSDADMYLRWAVDMARNLTTGVPWLLCHDVDQCMFLLCASFRFVEILMTLNDQVLL